MQHVGEQPEAEFVRVGVDHPVGEHHHRGDVGGVDADRTLFALEGLHQPGCVLARGAGEVEVGGEGGDEGALCGVDVAGEDAWVFVEELPACAVVGVEVLEEVGVQGEERLAEESLGCGVDEDFAAPAVER